LAEHDITQKWFARANTLFGEFVLSVYQKESGFSFLFLYPFSLFGHGPITEHDDPKKSQEKCDYAQPGHP
jgi:hypothetical protein